VLLQTIARALEWTTNLTTIVYSPRPHKIPVEAKVVRDLIPRGVANDSPRLLRVSVSQVEHPFRKLIGALYVSQYTGIRELRVEALQEGEVGTPFTFAFFDFPETVDFQAGKHLFKHLERCELNIKHWTSEDHDGGDIRIAALRKMLAIANELRHLALHIFDPQQDLDTRMAFGTHPTSPMMSRLGLQMTWPKLRSLSLRGIHAGTEQLLDLIRRHRYTLTSVLFRRCSLYAGTWADIVDEVVYNTRFLPFVLDSVREGMVPTGSGTFESTADLEEWRYEGHIEVSKDSERNFVSALLWRQ